MLRTHLSFGGNFKMANGIILVMKGTGFREVMRELKREGKEKHHSIGPIV